MEHSGNQWIGHRYVRGLRRRRASSRCPPRRQAPLGPALAAPAAKQILDTIGDKDGKLLQALSEWAKDADAAWPYTLRLASEGSSANMRAHA